MAGSAGVHHPKAPEVLFRSGYGGFPKFLWYFGLPAWIGLTLVFFVFADDLARGFPVRGVRVSPAVIRGVLCPVMGGMCAMIVGLGIYRRQNPQEIVVTSEGVVLPRGRWTRETISIPWRSLHATLYRAHFSFMDFYEVTCVDRRNQSMTRVASLLFRDFDDFATFAQLVGRRMGEDWSIAGFLPGTTRGRKPAR
jgi:hypothetical protein